MTCTLVERINVVVTGTEIELSVVGQRRGQKIVPVIPAAFALGGEAPDLRAVCAVDCHDLAGPRMYVDTILVHGDGGRDGPTGVERPIARAIRGFESPQDAVLATCEQAPAIDTNASVYHGAD